VRSIEAVEDARHLSQRLKALIASGALSWGLGLISVGHRLLLSAALDAIRSRFKRGFHNSLRRRPQAVGLLPC
jgi:hypothetical protein